MKYVRPKADPMKTLAIVLIGACMMLFVDLFMLGGKDVIFRAPVQREANKGSVDRLRDQHRRYMEGLDADLPAESASREEIYKGLNLTEAESSYLSKNEQGNGGIFPYEEFYEGGTIPPENVVPAAGENDSLEPPAQTFSDPYFKTEIALGHTQMPEETAPLPEHKNAPSEKQETLAVALAKATPSQTHSAAPVAPIKKGTVVIIIDDMGLSGHSREVENLPGPLTLAYLPYAANLPERTAYAREKGHELMVHMPMEPLSAHVDGGPTLLKSDQDEQKFLKLLHYNLSRFEGYVGVNNHMGSRLTQNREAMNRVMAELGRRGLYFIDSKTIGNSVAAQAAMEAGLAFSERDIFLDHEINFRFINNALRQVELTAQRKGYAIAIGHPHAETIRALTAWLPTLKDKGLTLKPASAVVRRSKANVVMASAPSPGSQEKLNEGNQVESLNVIAPASGHAETEIESPPPATLKKAQKIIIIEDVSQTSSNTPEQPPPQPE